MKFNRHTIPNAWSALRRFLRALFSKQPVLADDHVTRVRLSRCERCPHAEDNQCSLCTCVIPLKVIMATESCPAGRWDRQTKFSSGL